MKNTLKIGSFALESGVILPNVEATFSSYGVLNAQKSNVVWVCHALTANSDVLDWWSGLFGAAKLFDPKAYFIICVNALGSCYGTTGPTSPQENKRPILDKFPLVTTRDQARLFDEVRKRLRIDRISLVIGASLGGQQALEWAIAQPKVIDRLCLIATNAKHSAYGIAFNESQRMAIAADPTYANGSLHGGKTGLAAARSIAMLSYRSYEGYVATQTDESDQVVTNFSASSYQRYQGQKLVHRFSPYAYVTLLNAMDAHNVGRNRNSLKDALHSVEAQTLVVAIDSDQLFPPTEQVFLSEWIQNAGYAQITSTFGHDGFLIETNQLSRILSDFLNKTIERYKRTQFKKSAVA